jgi:hypothetical protein
LEAFVEPAAKGRASLNVEELAMNVVGGGESKERQAAVVQSLFREVNQRIVEVANGSTTEILCECCQDECTEPLVIPTNEYAAIRDSSTRFVVIAGHYDPTLERVVAEQDGYMIIEKFGEAGEAAQRLDQRSP